MSLVKARSMEDNETAMPDFRVPSKANVPIGPGTKVFTSLFFLFFLGIGSVFVWLVAREAVAGIGTWTWRKTSCEITHCEVSETGKRGQRTGNYYVAVTYRYTFNDQTFDSKKLSLTPKSFSDYGAAARLAAHYPPGGKTICYVNSSAAAEAVLERGNLLFPFLVLFPMIFVAIGAGGIYATWRRKPKPEESVRPISDLAGGRIAPVFVFVFFSIFLLVGGGLSYTFFLRPVFNVISAKRWPAVPCVVISSQVRTHHSGDGSTYSINILYSYDLNGRELKANRYSFMGASSSGYKGKSAIVARYPPGTETICYVNPSDPTEAVLQRGFTAEMWLGLIPLLFATIGAGGLVFAFRKRRQNRLTGAIGQRTEFGDAVANTFPGLHQTESSERRLLRPKVSPLCKWLIAIAIALFWNGIVSVFLAQIIRSRGSGPMEWFLAIFLIPFVVIGLGLLCASAYFFLALFNPRPRLRATPGLVPLGGAIEVEWEIHGRTNALRSLLVVLEGREEATFRRGENTTMEKSVFSRIEIAKVTDRLEMRSGTRVVSVPTALMHSFASKNNKIVWVISICGDIPRWPDVNDEFPLTVLPLARNAKPSP